MTMTIKHWNLCLERLEGEFEDSNSHFFLRSLQPNFSEQHLRLLAPNEIVSQWITTNALALIRAHATDLSQQQDLKVTVEVGSYTSPEDRQPAAATAHQTAAPIKPIGNRLDPSFTFDTFVEGHSNQMALAASRRVSSKPGTSYNPLFIYGHSGLGKTHLMQAVGNHIRRNQPELRVAYLTSERYVQDMVTALQQKKADVFKRLYRSVDVLMIDDIQFLGGKERSQDEFFHTFNSLIEDKKQIILTGDKFHKEIDGLEERLKNRFGWGLTVRVAEPELETRVAILMSKAEQMGWQLPDEVAFFVARRVRANVRELEGNLKRIIAMAEFEESVITMDLTKEALRDLMQVMDRKISIDNIQKEIADKYRIRVTDLTSARRSRSIARPRQMAMAIAKELTDRSLPEIGREFGGRDHTTVLYAVRKIADLRKTDSQLAKDYDDIVNLLTT